MHIILQKNVLKKIIGGTLVVPDNGKYNQFPLFILL